MAARHRLLARQLKVAQTDGGGIDMDRLLDAVSLAYEESDQDRRRTDHSITLMIQEVERLTVELSARHDRRLRAAIDHMSHGLAMFDGDERLVICNGAYADIYGLPPVLTEPGTPLEAIFQHRISTGSAARGGAELFVRGRRTTIRERRFLKEVIELEDGRAISTSHHPIPDGGWVTTHEDITEQRRNEERVRHLARHDALTDLPNRVLFGEQMAIAEHRIAWGETTAVLCLDLDHFKAVNDSLGHAVGDAVLVAVAQRLREVTREADTVARLGGDEFAILVPGLGGPDDAANLAGRLVRALTEPMRIEEHTVSVGCSIGIAVSPNDGDDAATLFRNADVALYRAKSEGRGNFHFFERGMDEALQIRRELEQGLKLALGRGEFAVAFQPLVNLETGRICCLEALLRWTHPVRGLISPQQFIPIAEETGLIRSIGEWVLREACREAATWPDGVRLAVNLSPVQFRGHALVGQVEAALADAGLDPARLELEITESLPLNDNEPTLRILHQLRGLGARIALDDFGTGYSSLSYLRSFPFDKIKIDRSFMRDLKTRSDSLAIIAAVIGLGHSLGMATIAEGIETEEQLALVREQGCDEGQGFLFSPPLPPGAVRELLARHTPALPRRRSA